MLLFELFLKSHYSTASCTMHTSAFKVKTMSLLKMNIYLMGPLLSCSMYMKFFHFSLSISIILTVSRSSEQVWRDLPQIRCRHQRDREVDQQPAALQTVRLRGAHHLGRDHGPRGGQEEASRGQDPGILLLNIVMKQQQRPPLSSCNTMACFTRRNIIEKRVLFQK